MAVSNLRLLFQDAVPINAQTKIVRVQANPTAGTAQALTATLASQGVNVQTMVGFTIDNQYAPGSGSVYLRTAGGLGFGYGQTGIKIPTGSQMSFAFERDSDDTLGHENSAAFFVITYHEGGSAKGTR